MNKNFKTLPLVCGLLTIGVTALLYILLAEAIFATTVKWLSALFVLIAEAIILVKVLFDNEIHILNAQKIVSVLYVLGTVGVSLVFINIASLPVKRLIAIEAAMLVILVVIDLTILNLYKRLFASDIELAHNQAVFGEYTLMVSDIIAENPSSEYKKQLNELYEMLKYSDNTKLLGAEAEIAEKLTELRTLLKNSAGDKEAIEAQIGNIKTVIQKRTNHIKQNQRGSF